MTTESIRKMSYTSGMGWLDKSLTHCKFNEKGTVCVVICPDSLVRSIMTGTYSMPTSKNDSFHLRQFTWTACSETYFPRLHWISSRSLSAIASTRLAASVISFWTEWKTRIHPDSWKIACGIITMKWAMQHLSSCLFPVCVRNKVLIILVFSFLPCFHSV